MDNIIAVIILLVILSSAVIYVYRQKKKGNHCIGCPYSSSCNKRNCKDK